MGALMFVFQVAMSGLPNIHITDVFIIITVVFFGWKALYSVAVFIMLEGLVWGISMWWFCYWYLWPVFVVACIIMRKNDSALIWAVVAGMHGICFGALCSIPFLFMGGWQTAFARWISGITFDFAHCAGNFVFTLILYHPLKKVMSIAMKEGKI